MGPLIVVLCIIGVVMLLAKFLPDIFESILSVIGLVILAALIGGIWFVVSLFT